MNKGKPPDARPRPWEREDRSGSFGSWLRQQREVRGVSLREIADASRISLRYLEALEQDHFEVLPAPVFARGFLREYARFVGLDADQVVNDFILAQQAAEPTLIDEPPRARERSLGASPWGYGVLLTVAVLVFLSIATALSFYAGRRHGSSPSRTTPPVASAPAPSVVPAVAEPPAVQSPPPAATTGAVPASATPVAPPVAGSESAEPAAAGTAPAAPPLRLSLDFSQDCWVRVQIDGRRWYSKQYAAGESLTVDAEQEVLLSLGNAGGVTALVNGRPWPLPAGDRAVVKDLRIDLASLAAPPGPVRQP